MNNLLSVVASLNDKGVQHLACANFTAASESFDRALKVLAGHRTAENDDSIIRAEHSSLFLRLISVDHILNDLHAFTYTKALTFQTKGRWVDDDALLAYGFVKYNAALLLHIQDQGDGAKSRRAFPLYLQALRALQAVPGQAHGGSEVTASATIAAISCINNMSEVYIDFNRLEKARALMLSVAALLNSLREGQGDVLDRDSFHFFLKNETFLSMAADMGQAAPSA